MYPGHKFTEGVDVISGDRYFKAKFLYLDKITL